MVSSLPFLAPVFVRKAKEYRSKHSNGYGSSGSHRSRGVAGKSGERYKLSSFNSRKDGSGTLGTTGASTSEEDILKDSRPRNFSHPNSSLHNPSGIVKSISYTVEVDDEEKGYKNRDRDMPAVIDNGL